MLDLVVISTYSALNYLSLGAKGEIPVNNSYTRTPTDQISTVKSCLWFFSSISGAK